VLICRGLRVACFSASNPASAALVLTGTPASTVDVAFTLTGTADEIRAGLAELIDDEALSKRALDRLEAGAADAYDAALAILHPSTRAAWVEQLAWQPGDYDEGETPDPRPPRISCAISPGLSSRGPSERRCELDAAPKVRLQALGESLDPDKLERLGRYEVHLDRKFERTLATLLRLQELRRDRAGPRVKSVSQKTPSRHAHPQLTTFRDEKG
jgi:hypothetical protein